MDLKVIATSEKMPRQKVTKWTLTELSSEKLSEVKFRADFDQPSTATTTYLCCTVGKNVHAV